MSIRAATPGDLPAIADLFGSVEEAVLGRSSALSADSVEGWFQTVSFDTNTWLVEEGGAVIAGAFGELHGELGNWAGAVSPQAQGRGLGSQLLGLVEARFAVEGAARLHSWTLTGDTRASGLFATNGYREVRRFLEMAIELETEPPEPAEACETFREEDGPSFHAALEEAFADHWEHQPETFEHWWARQRRRANFDPSLWLLIRDGDEVAAVCRSETRREGGYVGAIGVRHAWRGRGFGRALLLASFREFSRRGLSRATLGVDAANATGATQLYESVGMHVDLENTVWEKILA